MILGNIYEAIKDCSTQLEGIGIQLTSLNKNMESEGGLVCRNDFVTLQDSVHNLPTIQQMDESITEKIAANDKRKEWESSASPTKMRVYRYLRGKLDNHTGAEVRELVDGLVKTIINK